MSGALLLVAVLVLFALAGIAALVVGGGFVWWRRSAHPRRPSVPSRTVVPEAPARTQVGGQLHAYHQAGRNDELLRFLERTMPEWPVASSLIEVARELLALERRVASARDAGVLEPVTSRLTQEAERIAGPLWELADRVAAAAAIGVASPVLHEELTREDDKLLRLLSAIREARAGLAELTLSGTGERDELRRAEGRFRALAETSRELRDLGR